MRFREYSISATHRRRVYLLNPQLSNYALRSTPEYRDSHIFYLDFCLPDSNVRFEHYARVKNDWACNIYNNDNNDIVIIIDVNDNPYTYTGRN